MRKFALHALVLLPLSAFGCTALLGSFEVDPKATGTDGGGTDGPVTTDGEGPVDADTDSADAQSLVFTTCGINETSVRTIEEMEVDGNVGFYVGQLQIFRLNDQTLRVIAQKSDNGDGAVVYTFDPNMNGQNGPINPQVLDLRQEGRYFDVRRLPNQGILALLFMERSQAAPVAHMKVIELSDVNPAPQNIRVSADFPNPMGSGGGGGFGGALGAYQNNNEYFWAIGGWPSAVQGNYDLMVGHRVSAAAQPAPVVVHTTSDERLTRIRAMARSQTVQYIFNDKGPDSIAEEGSSYFPVPQDTTTAVVPKALRPVGGTKPWVLIGASGLPTGDGIRLAVAEVDFNATNFGQVRAGIVPQADLTAGFDGTKVPPAFTLTSLAEVPSEGEARFFGDDMLWLGTPPDPLSGQGFNLLWFNTKAGVMRANQTGMKRMLTTHQSIEKSSIWLDPAKVTAVTADADVVFTERVGTKDVLRYARLSCIR